MMLYHTMSFDIVSCMQNTSSNFIGKIHYNKEVVLILFSSLMLCSLQT